jgi:hypothetical protein
MGNYGGSLAFKLGDHVALTIPLEFYTFKNSILGNVAIKTIQNVATSNGFDQVTALTMMHIKGGLGFRFFFTPSALASGFYVEPVFYAGLIRSNNFNEILFETERDALRAVINLSRQNVPISNYFAMSPQLNMGYQWISSFGLVTQLEIFGSYVYAPKVDSIFNAAQRLLGSGQVPGVSSNSLESRALTYFRALGTQMNGWHAGLAFNLGFAF